MPIVTISWWKGKDREAKQRVVEKIEKVMQEEGGVRPGDTYIVINEYDPEDWAINGKLGAIRQADG